MSKRPMFAQIISNRQKPRAWASHEILHEEDDGKYIITRSDRSAPQGLGTNTDISRPRVGQDFVNT